MLQHPVHLIPDYLGIVAIAGLVVFAQLQDSFQPEPIGLCPEEGAELRVVDMLLTRRVDR